MNAVCSTEYSDNRLHERIRANGLDMVKSVLGKVLDANQAIAMHQLDVYSMQVDEARATAPSDNPDESQETVAVERDYAIRADMNRQVQCYMALNTLIAFGSMALEVFFESAGRAAGR